MAANQLALTPTRGGGPLMGLANMLRKENARWWRTRYGLQQAALWLATTNFFVAVSLFSTASERLSAPSAKMVMALQLFFLLGGLLTAMGAVVTMQGALIGERQSGTAAWVLSKPLSRPAFILGKLLANAFGLFVTGVLLPALAACGLCLLAGTTVPAPEHLAAALGLFGLHVLFYVALTLMLGTFFAERGPVAGLGLAVLFGPQLLRSVLPVFNDISPMGLVMPLGEGSAAISLAGAAILGLPLPTVAPLAWTVAWCLLCTAIAIVRFSRQEF
ncbi:MAG: ABC transporter permease [Chloroflexota bacterium]